MSGIAFALIAALLWGVVYATTQDLVQRMNAADLLAVTYGAGGCLGLPYLLYRQQAIRNSVYEAGWLMPAYLLTVLIAESMIIVSISSIGGIEASLIEVTYPVWTALVLYLWKGEAISPTNRVGGILILTGVFFIAYMEGKTSRTRREGPAVEHKMTMPTYGSMSEHSDA